MHTHTHACVSHLMFSTGSGCSQRTFPLLPPENKIYYKSPSNNILLKYIYDGHNCKSIFKKIRTPFGGAPAPLWQPALYLGFWEAPPPHPALKGEVSRHPPTPGCILSWAGLKCPWDSVKMQILMRKSQAGARGSAFMTSSKLMATMWFWGPLLSALEGCRGLCYCRWSRNPTL